jgi:hypothetical protein
MYGSELLWCSIRMRVMLRLPVHTRWRRHLLMAVIPRASWPRSVAATRCRGASMVFATSRALAFMPSRILAILLFARNGRERVVLRDHLWLVRILVQSCLFFGLPLLHCTFLRFLWWWHCLTRPTVRLRRSWSFVWPVSAILYALPLSVAVSWILLNPLWTLSLVAWTLLWVAVPWIMPSRLRRLTARLRRMPSIVLVG